MLNIVSNNLLLYYIIKKLLIRTDDPNFKTNINKRRILS